MSLASGPRSPALRTTLRCRAPMLLVLAALSTLLLALLVATGVSADEPGEQTEPGDIKFVRQAAGMDDVSPATFPHWIHRMAYTCYACHDSVYPMRAGESLVTMDQIQAGQSCGACHDGKTAFVSNLTTCNRCHR